MKKIITLAMLVALGAFTTTAQETTKKTKETSLQSLLDWKPKEK